MRVRWTTPAKEQFVSIYECIGEENRSAAAKIADQIWENAQLLGRHPLAGRAGRVEATRELVIQGAPFIVEYRVEKNEVWILAVLHAARKWPEEF
ncbi:MAG TPA: type II toxin-antitoxin system RelE/ParE family toxin, partial [Candidatus Dormibacteraeota bacterium]|nr:type II toxin-antitoxin system RelE/ParE family toxin [Candidatus Dormibacteraeota bacterium]